MGESDHKRKKYCFCMLMLKTFKDYKDKLEEIIKHRTYLFNLGAGYNI